MDEGWLTGQMTEAMGLGGEDEGKERKVVAGAISNGQNICAFFAKEHFAGGDYSFLDTQEFYHYVHMKKLGGSSRKRQGLKTYGNEDD